jgi:hypothetical protein
LSRIEITFYAKIPPMDQFRSQMEEIKELLLPGCNFTPIEKQWTELGSVLSESTLIYYCRTTSLSMVRWINKTTGKANGWIKDKYGTQVDFEKLLQWATFYNLPIKLYMLDYTISTVSKGKGQSAQDSPEAPWLQSQEAQDP